MCRPRDNAYLRILLLQEHSAALFLAGFLCRSTPEQDNINLTLVDGRHQAILRDWISRGGEEHNDQAPGNWLFGAYWV